MGTETRRDDEEETKKHPSKICLKWRGDGRDRFFKKASWEGDFASGTVITHITLTLSRFSGLLASPVTAPQVVGC